MCVLHSENNFDQAVTFHRKNTLMTHSTPWNNVLAVVSELNLEYLESTQSLVLGMQINFFNMLICLNTGSACSVLSALSLCILRSYVIVSAHPCLKVGGWASKMV